ncbi:MAG: sugar ABC transporter ATP-binding protein [Mesorhizobium amorphae]|nr:MAG: sugar ABC transporter ATP-binding protein [Mesorhizobium amorphae]
MAQTTPLTPSHSTPVLELRGISKRFGALQANDAIDLVLRRGEVLALLGENGAGKTTLMNILFGHYAADSGAVLVADGAGALHPLAPGNPAAALQAGIGMVHQHFALADKLSALENITLGTQSLWAPARRDGAARARLDALMKRSGLAVDLDGPVSRLSVGERQRVEILKALYRDARILVLDEPTAVLTPQESLGLFDTLRALTADGLSVILISHKLDEILAASDRVAVLRHGRKVGEVTTRESSKQALAELMVGRSVPSPAREARLPGPAVLELRGVSVENSSVRRRLEDVSLRVHAGEIVGIAGVSGNGQSALADLLSGLVTPQRGDVRLGGEAVTRFDPGLFVHSGIGRVPEDRHHEGAVGAMTVAENTVLENLREPRFQRWGFLRKGRIDAHARQAIRDFDIRCPGPDAAIRQLSGGNMQKVILARALDREPRLVLANQPTRGLDVGAVAAVHGRLLAARDRGAGVMLISEDLDEILALADRIAVIFRAKLSEAMPAAALDRSALGLMMAGHGDGQAGEAA